MAWPSANPMINAALAASTPLTSIQNPLVYHDLLVNLLCEPMMGNSINNVATQHTATNTVTIPSPSHTHATPHHAITNLERPHGKQRYSAQPRRHRKRCARRRRRRGRHGEVCNQRDQSKYRKRGKRDQTCPHATTRIQHVFTQDSRTVSDTCTRTHARTCTGHHCSD